ncbi:MAG: D-glycero-beta-D-manno-heptose 1-phosphate adenylyltransferase [Chloroflexota bacterium]|nr:D-glycero-beta-D-manno-heptose 1-phosphate adenylyltransferase [Chloroflexota bacterium]
MPAIDRVRGFRKLKALVIGDAMVDSYLEGDASRLCSEGPVPVVRQTVEEHVPGGAANTAVNMRSLGAEVIFLGLVGHDVAGTLLREAMHRRDLDDSWLVADSAVSTLHKTRILANEQYVVRYDSGETRHASPEARAEILRCLETALPTCDLVVISDYAYGMVQHELLARLRDLRRHHPCPLIVDSKDLRSFATAGATVVTPNHLEARLAVNWRFPHDEPHGTEGVEATGRALLDLLDSEYATVTMGQHGVMVVGREGPGVHLPSHPVPRVNDVGAGDSFTAAMSLALGVGAGMVDAARIGIVAAGISVSRPRTAAVQLGELLQRVSLTDGPGQPTAAALREHLDDERRRGRTIVFTNGVFDILHAGHVHFLREARRLGDVLIVGINSDRSARRLKGPGRPINSELDRLALVAELDAVDYVVQFDEDEPTNLIRVLRPDIHVKGGDYQDTTLPEEQAVREVGGRVVILPLVGSISTSTVIEHILALAPDLALAMQARGTS